MLRSAAIAITLVCCDVAQAADDAVERFKNYTPQQIMSMSEKDRSNQVPMMFIGAANLAMVEAGDLILQASLNALMYNGFADYEGAKKEFQKDLGEEPTGNLTVWQIHSITYRASRLNLTPVSFFPLGFVSMINEDVATVKGTVKILDEKIAYPINYTTVDCFRPEGFCRYRQIALTVPDENSFMQSYHIGEVASEYYRITRWESDQIDASPLNNTSCRINQLSFNFTTKEFFEIARNNSSGECTTAFGSELPRLKKPRVSQIVDGNDIVAGEFRLLQDEVRGYYSSAFRQRVGMIKTTQAGTK